MQAVSAVYVRMNALLTELGRAAGELNREITSLKDKVRKLYVSWEGEAYDEYSRVLMEDLTVMELTALDVVMMYQLLSSALSKYQGMELKISETVGGIT